MNALSYIADMPHATCGANQGLLKSVRSQAWSNVVRNPVALVVDADMQASRLGLDTTALTICLPRNQAAAVNRCTLPYATVDAIPVVERAGMPTLSSECTFTSSCHKSSTT